MRTAAEWGYQVFALLELLGRGGKRDEAGGVVVCASGHLGDFLQLTPMLRALRERTAGRKVTWLVGGWSMGLARRYAAWADEIAEFSPQLATLTRGNPAWERCVADQWRLLRRLRKEGVDLLVCTRWESPEARFAANTLRPKTWVGFGDRRPPRVREDVRTVFAPYEKSRPEAEAQLHLLELAGLGAPGEWRLEYEVREEERAWAEIFLGQEGVGEKPLALLSPGSGWNGKNWPAERFAELARRLEARGMDVAWTGTDKERNLCQGPGRKWMGKLSLEQLAAVMERSAVWVGNDSGTLHLAVAVGCRTVSFWGPTNEGKWGPKGAEHRTLRGRDACPGCVYWDWRRECGVEGHPCLAAISVDAAARAVGAVLAVT